MDGFRRAALALHGLNESDRHWVLGRLQGAERTRLTQLLEELHTLGIPPDRSLLAGIKEAAPREQVSPSSASSSPSPKTSSSKLRDADAAAMLAILAHEPATLIAPVLRIEAWPWEADFLARLDPPLRREISVARQGESGAALSSALIAAIEARLETYAQSGAPEPAKRERLLAWTRLHARQARAQAREWISTMASRWAR
jgi:hypothetical protein